MIVGDDGAGDGIGGGSCAVGGDAEEVLRGRGGGEVGVAGEVDVGAVGRVRDGVEAVEVREGEWGWQRDVRDVGAVELGVGVLQLGADVAGEEGVAGGEFDEGRVVEDVLGDGGSLGVDGRGCGERRGGEILYKSHFELFECAKVTENAKELLQSTQRREQHGGRSYYFILSTITVPNYCSV